MGLILHHFDGFESKGREWQPCDKHGNGPRCGNNEIAGRMSCSISWAGLHQRADRVAITLMNNNGGIIVRPSEVSLDCLYAVDGNTASFNGAISPGCSSAFSWCDPKNPLDQNGLPSCGFRQQGRAFRPENLKEARLCLPRSDLDAQSADESRVSCGQALQLYAQYGAPYQTPSFNSGYNEVTD